MLADISWAEISTSEFGRVVDFLLTYGSTHAGHAEGPPLRQRQAIFEILGSLGSCVSVNQKDVIESFRRAMWTIT